MYSPFLNLSLPCSLSDLTDMVEFQGVRSAIRSEVSDGNDDCAGDDEELSRIIVATIARKRLRSTEGGGNDWIQAQEQINAELPSFRLTNTLASRFIRLSNRKDLS